MSKTLASKKTSSSSKKLLHDRNNIVISPPIQRPKKKPSKQKEQRARSTSRSSDRGRKSVGKSVDRIDGRRSKTPLNNATRDRRNRSNSSKRSNSPTRNKASPRRKPDSAASISTTSSKGNQKNKSTKKRPVSATKVTDVRKERSSVTQREQEFLNYLHRKHVSQASKSLSETEIVSAIEKHFPNHLGKDLPEVTVSDDIRGFMVDSQRKPPLSGAVSPSGRKGLAHRDPSIERLQLPKVSPKGSFMNTGWTAHEILEKTSYRPKVAIICGSIVGCLADNLEDKEEFTYEELDFPRSETGKDGKLVFGTLSGKQVVCMKGRIHFYEGHSSWMATAPIRILGLLGVTDMIITCAACSLNPAYKVGDIVVIKDHINLPSLVGFSPLIGPNDEYPGPRFLSLTNAYDKELRSLAHQAARQLGLPGLVREGVYVLQAGPTYETPAEVNFFRLIGGDLAGMSCAMEVTTAKNHGIRSLALGLVTSKADDSIDYEHNDNVETVIDHAGRNIEALVASIVESEIIG